MRNDYRVDGESVFVKVMCKGETYEAKASTDKLDKLLGFDVTWFGHRYSTGVYLEAKKNKKMVRFHRFITDAPEGMVVDHINNDTLDNTNENLRVVSHRQNIQNVSGVRSDSGTGVRGVCLYPHNQKYSAYCTHKGKRHYGGVFATIEEAEKKAIEMRKSLFVD